MTRPPRILFKSAWYHIMNRGAGRKCVFKTEDQRKLFVDLLAESSTDFNMEAQTPGALYLVISH